MCFPDTGEKASTRARVKLITFSLHSANTLGMGPRECVFFQEIDVISA